MWTNSIAVEELACRIQHQHCPAAIVKNRARYYVHDGHRSRYLASSLESDGEDEGTERMNVRAGEFLFLV